MRLPLAILANGAAGAVLACLGAVAVVLVILLGPFGLVLLGLLTLLVCTQFTLDEHAPTWSALAFQARMTPPGSPEARAAAQETRQSALAPVRFYKLCGALLVVAGGAGLAWQHWH